MLVAAVEAGGTKIVLGLLESGREGVAPTILEKARIPTGEPIATADASAEWLESAFRIHGRPDRLGIASFGPLAGRFGTPSWGCIGSTPKPGWSGFDFAGLMRKRLGLATRIDTDVNAAALAEGLWGASRGLADHVYVTVGTGIGGGVVSNGVLLHGAGHPETGHVPVPREADDDFPGLCPFHGACLEGMASGPALAARWGAPAETLPPGHPAWDLEARYLASGLAPLVLVLAPERIVMGGGLISAPGLIEKTRARLSERLAGYVPRLVETGAMEGFLVAPSLGSYSGLIGAAALVLF